jgi:hypothetical protein
MGEAEKNILCCGILARNRLCIENEKLQIEVLSITEDQILFVLAQHFVTHDFFSVR